MTTYRSGSRGLMYTAPPSGDEENRSRPKLDGVADKIEDDADESEAETESGSEPTAADERASPTLEPTTATTDANWTGTVPADD